MKRRKDKPEKISDIAGGLPNSSVIKTAFELIPVWKQWETIIGEDFAEYTSLAGFKRGVLYIQVKNTAVMHRLTFEKERILEAIRGLLKKDLVQDIFFELNKDVEE
ncbi:MAG TPA: DUF721 domain-containing protein [Candidatus Hydrogenedens sp.]|nr:DUF721 domain-containing protein [Candidatus Hydrogenedens sp.]HOK09362.1 DUF721 domain-containing protein [Candidatus Hydrogenedens sp.]HOL20146.1 DUF721 domain-containing protein [Candidatus Hydrogenedens sp.]HPP58568.1 DUF721 domain-containing protein [Candidatus Hydrogenedens sp.]